MALSHDISPQHPARAIKQTAKIEKSQQPSMVVQQNDRIIKVEEPITPESICSNPVEAEPGAYDIKIEIITPDIYKFGLAAAFGLYDAKEEVLTPDSENIEKEVVTTNLAEDLDDTKTEAVTDLAEDDYIGIPEATSQPWPFGFPVLSTKPIAARFCTSIKHLSEEIHPDLSNLPEAIFQMWMVRCCGGTQGLDMPRAEIMAVAKLTCDSIRGRRLMLTYSGHVGVASTVAAPDDCIFLVPGDRDLQILRREPGHAHGVYRFVSYCRVDCPLSAWDPAVELAIKLV